MGRFCVQRNRDSSASPRPRPGGLRTARGPGFSLFSRADLTELEPRPGRGLARTPFPLQRPGTRPRPARPARPAACPAGPLPGAEGAGAPRPPHAPGAPESRRHGNRPARGAGWRGTHSEVASAGMCSAGPSVRSPRPEQLTRQAEPGSGPQRQGGAHGPQPHPEPPASAASHRPRPRASARRAGAAGGIVRAACAWPRPGPERPRARPAPVAAAQAGPADGMAGRGAGSGGGRGLSPCATPARRSGPAALCVHRRPVARSRCSAGPPPPLLLLLPARGGAARGPAPRSAGRPRTGAGRHRAPAPSSLMGWAGRRAAARSGGGGGGWASAMLPLRALPRPPASGPRRVRAPLPSAAASVTAVPIPAVITTLCPVASPPCSKRLAHGRRSGKTHGVLSYRSSRAPARCGGQCPLSQRRRPRRASAGGGGGGGPAQHPRPPRAGGCLCGQRTCVPSSLKTMHSSGSRGWGVGWGMGSNC